MDEILASIRKIIAEEPVGSRPVPATSAKTAAPSPRTAMFADPPLPGAATATATAKPDPAKPEAMRPGASAISKPVPAPAQAEPRRPDAPRPESSKTDPIAAAMARAAHAPSPPVTAMQGGHNSASAAASAPFAAAAPLPAFASAPVASAEDTKLFGRLAEALRGGSSALPAVDPIPAAPTPAAPAPVVAAPASVVVADDLDDLLADAPSVVAGYVQSTGSTAAAFASEATDARAMHRRTVDFGAIVPQRADTAVDASAAVAPSGEGERQSAKPTAHAAAFDKMLSARLAAGKPEPAQPEPAPTGPVVIAAMPDAPDAAAEVTASDKVAMEIEDPDAAEAAKSAFGALMAGLAASGAASPAGAGGDAVSQVMAEAPASEPESTAAAAARAGLPGGADTADKPVAKPGAAVAVTAAKALAQMQPAAASGGVHKPAGTAEADKAVTAKVTVAKVNTAPVAASSLAPTSSPAQAVLLAAEAADAAKPPVEPSRPVAAPGATSAAPTATPASALAVPAAQAVAAPTVLALGGVRTVEDIVAELLRPMLREWLAENMPRMVEKALRIELAEGLKTVNQAARKPTEDRK